MKILLVLGALALLATGCERESTMTEDTGLLEMYETDENSEESGSVDPETGASVAEEDLTSVGPTDIPADLIPSR